MQTLRNALEQSEKDGVAIGHFNVSDLVLLKAVVAAARDLKVPVALGASEGEREFFGVRQIAALVRSLREEYDYPIFLNADHTHSLAHALDVARAGFDSVVFDLFALPFEQNVRQTKEAVEALKAVNPAILVEGEIGDIGTGSEIHEAAPDLSKGLTSPQQAKQFVESTGIDILAPAVGNMHGMLKSMVQGQARKRLDIERIAQIKSAVQKIVRELDRYHGFGPYASSQRFATPASAEPPPLALPEPPAALAPPEAETIDGAGSEPLG